MVDMCWGAERTQQRVFSKIIRERNCTYWINIFRKVQRIDADATLAPAGEPGDFWRIRETAAVFDEAQLKVEANTDRICTNVQETRRSGTELQRLWEKSSAGSYVPGGVDVGGEGRMASMEEPVK